MKKKRTAPFRDIITSYVSHVRSHTLLAVVVFVGSIGAQLVGIAIPVYLSRFFNELVAHTYGSSALPVIYAILGTIAVLFLLQWVFRRMMGISIMVFESRVMHDLYAATFDYLLRHSNHFFASQFSGTLTRRVSKYVHAFEQLFDSLAMSFTPTIVYIVGAVLVLYQRSPVLGLALAGWSALFFLFQLYVSHLRQPVRVQRSEADSAMIGGLADAITNQHSIMLFANLRLEYARFTALVARWREATNRSWLVDEYIWAAQGLFMIAIQVGLLFGAVHFWQKGELLIGDFVLIQTYLLGIIENLISITRELRRVYDAVADAGEMVSILNEPHEIRDMPEAAPLVVRDAEITFDRVSFQYRNAQSGLLRDFTLSIGSRQKVGIVGRSGAGKSTLVRLLLRQYDVQDGVITVDGQNVQTVTQESLRRAIGVVPQEPLLFHRTILENIGYGKAGASEVEIRRAAELAQADTFISRLPHGYDSYVGERGIKLSGGERQRIAIARAILKDAPILLLDEATSALDSESEVVIQKALHTLMEGKTVLAIAHRLSTLREMDRIIVLDEGQIVEDGRHEELLSRGGVYATLWSHQAGAFLKDEE